MSNEKLIDLPVLRDKLTEARDLLRPAVADGAVAAALELITEALTMISPVLDPNAQYSSVSEDAMTVAMTAAMDALIAQDVPNPAALLIVQSHDDSGQITGRTLATTIANPQDVLETVMTAVRARAARDSGSQT